MSGPGESTTQAPQLREAAGDYESLMTITVVTERQSRHVSGTVYADGRVTTPFDGGHVKGAPTASIGAQYGYQRVHSTEAGPSTGHKLSTGGSEGVHGFKAKVHYEVTVNDHSRVRSWIRRITPASALSRPRSNAQVPTVTHAPRVIAPSSRQDDARISSAVKPIVVRDRAKSCERASDVIQAGARASEAPASSW